ncbi:MAG: ribosome maturation factor RimM [Pseudomonadota bacterium]
MTRKPTPTDQREDEVCLGVIGGAHGVKGAFKVKTYTEDEADIDAYGPLRLQGSDTQLDLRVVRVLKEALVLATTPTLTSPEAVRELTGLELYVQRDRLPALDDDDDFYQEDLVGLHAVTSSGAPIGRVKSVQNFGAGDILEVTPKKGSSVFVPFTREMVPEIDIEGGKITLADDAVSSAQQTDGADREKGDAATQKEVEQFAEKTAATLVSDNNIVSHENIISDETGDIVSPDQSVNVGAMREEDA